MFHPEDTQRYESDLQECIDEIKKLTAERDELKAAAATVVDRWEEGRFGGSDSKTNRVRWAVDKLSTALDKCKRGS